MNDQRSEYVFWRKIVFPIKYEKQKKKKGSTLVKNTSGSGSSGSHR